VHKPLLWAWKETANYWNFWKSKGHNSVKHGLIVPKAKPDLDIFMINLYTKFYFKMCNQCKENERKRQIIGILQSPRGITLLKIARSYSKQNMTSIFLWYICIPHSISICTTSAKKMNGNCWWTGRLTDWQADSNKDYYSLITHYEFWIIFSKAKNLHRRTLG
jgi:hypothetical protein